MREIKSPEGQRPVSPAKRDIVLLEFLENGIQFCLRVSKLTCCLDRKDLPTSFAAGFSCSLSGVLLVLMEKPSLGIRFKLLLFLSLVEQEQEAALLNTLFWDILGWCCSGTGQLGRAEMCLDNLMLLGNKVVLSFTVRMVGLSRSGLRAHLAVS